MICDYPSPPRHATPRWTGHGRACGLAGRRVLFRETRGGERYHHCYVKSSVNRLIPVEPLFTHGDVNCTLRSSTFAWIHTRTGSPYAKDFTGISKKYIIVVEPARSKQYLKHTASSIRLRLKEDFSFSCHSFEASTAALEESRNNVDSFHVQYLFSTLLGRGRQLCYGRCMKHEPWGKHY